LRLRVVTQPEKELGQLLGRLGLPQRPKIMANAVPKNDSKSCKCLQIRLDISLTDELGLARKCAGRDGERKSPFSSFLGRR